MNDGCGFPLAVWTLALALLAACVAWGDGVWKVAEPGRRITLPADHVSHPDYKIEWWYYTGNVDTADGRRFGYQLTFFRVGVDAAPVNPSRWTVRDLSMAHFAVTDAGAGTFHFFDRLQRTGAGWAGAATDRYHVWNGSWSVEAEADGSHHLRASHDDVAIDLVLRGTARSVNHGRDGYSQKGRDPGNASHYYSLPRLATTGTIATAGTRHAVTGLSWMDHEFGTSLLEADQLGWDWFALQLADGRDIMLYQMRRRDGSRDPFSTGTIVSPDGAVVRLAAGDYTLEPIDRWQSPATGATYPTRWRVSIPGQRLTLDVQAVLKNQELHTPRSTGVTYWEGAVDVTGGAETGAPAGTALAGAAAGTDAAAGPRTIRGRGYMELTGYAGVPLSESLK
jgi:predicted secreted hydrolase